MGSCLGVPNYIENNLYSDIYVPHVKQLHDWDCGLACVDMVLRYFGILSDSLYTTDLDWMGCKESVWTIDLARLLSRKRIRHTYFTTTKGVGDYKHMPFYKNDFETDEMRVNYLWKNLKRDGVRVKIRSVSMNSLLKHVQTGHVVICLVDANIINCTKCNEKSSKPKGKHYQGHYVVVCGFDKEAQEILYKNPAANHELCGCCMVTFQDARTTEGTDGDALFINSTIS